MIHSSKFTRGFSLIEIIVATAVLFLALTGIVTAYNMFVRVGVTTLKTIQAAYLLEEGVEAVVSLRDFGWAGNIANLTSNSNYYLFWNGSRWLSTSTASKIDNTHTRYFTLSNVNRDSSDAIVTSGGTDDAGTKKLTMTVSWQSGATTTFRTISTYITNLFSN